MTIGVNYGFGFSVTPLIAVDGDRLDISVGLQALDGSELPSGTSVRLIVTTSGDVSGVLSRSALVNVEEGYFQSYTISSGENGGTISARVTHAFIGDEDEPRNIVGRNSANIRVLPQAQARSAPEPSDMIQVLPARTTIYDGQRAQFFITGRGQHIRGLDYSVGFDAPGVTEVGDGCNNGSVGHQWLGLPQTTFCTARVSGEINPGGENAESAAGVSFGTGHIQNISSNGSVTYSILNPGGDTATIDVIARNESLVAEGNTSNGNNNEGWQMFTRDDNPEPFDPEDEDRVYHDISTVDLDDRVQRTTTLTEDNSGVDTASVDEGITLVDNSSDPIPEDAIVDTMDESSEFITDNDEIPSEEEQEPQREPRVTGSGRKGKRGRGRSRANPSNSYEGPTNIEGGELEVPAGGLGRSIEINLSNNTTIAYDNTDEQVVVTAEAIMNMTGNTTIENINGITDYRGRLIGASDSVVTIRSVNNGGIAFRKASPDFSGSTIVERNAELLVDQDIGEAHGYNGDVDVYGSLKSQGTINGNVTMRSGSYLLVGAEVGTTTHITGNLIIESGCNVHISLLENGNDKLIVDGNITIQDGVNLVLIPFENTIMSDSYTLVEYGGTRIGQFAIPIINYKDNLDNNGLDTVDDSDYPDTIIYDDTNKIITGTK